MQNIADRIGIKQIRINNYIISNRYCMLEQELRRMLFVVDIIVPHLRTNFILHSIAMYRFTPLHTKG